MTGADFSRRSTSDGPLRCGVIGVGRMGRHHARVYSELPGAELVGVHDQDAERRERIAEDRGCRPFETPEDLFDAGVDAVTIAVPTVDHLRIATPFLERGVACLIEKPLAPDVEEASRIVEIAEGSGAVLQVGHIERFNPAVRALSRLQQVDGGATPIAPRFIEVHRVSPMSFRSVDVSVVFDMMIHDLDVVLMLVGGVEPNEVQGAGVPVVTEHADVCNARLAFETAHGPCVANITASRLALKTERKIRIVAEDAYVSIDYAKKSGVVIRKTANQTQLDEVREALREGKDLSDLNYGELVSFENLEIDDAEPLRLQLEAFLESVRTGRRPDVDARAGFAAVRTAQRIDEAAKALWETARPG